MGNLMVGLDGMCQPLTMASQIFRERDLHSRDWETRQPSFTRRKSISISTFLYRLKARQVRAIWALHALYVDTC